MAPPVPGRYLGEPGYLSGSPQPFESGLTLSIAGSGEEQAGVGRPSAAGEYFGAQASAAVSASHVALTQRAARARPRCAFHAARASMPLERGVRRPLPVGTKGAIHNGSRVVARRHRCT